jgi:hypothetical protein
MTHRRFGALAPLLALILALAFPTGGCVLIAGAGAGYVISREISAGDIYSAELEADADHVWEATREALEILADLNCEPVFTSSSRTARAKIDGAEVVVEVEAFDLGRSLLRVQAKKLMHSDAHTAELVQRKIIDRL